LPVIFNLYIAPCRLSVNSYQDRGTTLLNNFLDRVIAKDIHKFHIDQTLYYPEITGVEKLLRQAFNKHYGLLPKEVNSHSLQMVASTNKKAFQKN